VREQEENMAWVQIQKSEEASWDDYERVSAAVGDAVPAGLILHAAGPVDGRWQAVGVWESKAAFEAFREERILPAVRATLGDGAVAAGPPPEEGFEVKPWSAGRSVEEETKVRKRLSLAGTALAALAAGAALAAAAPQTISFVSVTARQSQTKNGFVIVDNDVVGKTKVGTDRVKCTFGEDNVAACVLTVTRPDGTIKGAFSLKGNASRGSLRIVGGAGAYEAATGTGTWRNLDKEGKRTAVTLKLA
jgi:hypothetical protein